MSARTVDRMLLLKPRVMSLVVFTGAVGYLTPPGPVDWSNFLATLTAMAGAAGACGALNMWWDADIDGRMARTAGRPIPRGAINATEALMIGIALALASVVTMALRVDAIAAALLVITIAIYLPFYTMWLKRRSPFNIVYGGASGALPPMIGWAASTHHLDAGAFALFLIIFLWTPPHFWALALRRANDYERVGVPMLPNVVGAKATCRQITIYCLLLAVASLAPLATNHLGPGYALAAGALNIGLLRRAWALRPLCKGPEVGLHKGALAMFGYSIFYLFALYGAILVCARLF